MTKVYWQGTPPSKCDLENEDLSKIGLFIDGKTRMGPWANMCPRCFANVGVGLGLGRGQKYEKQDDGRWLKIAG